MKIFSSTWIQKFKALGVTAKVGDVKASMLTEAQFNDPSWVLSDGRDVTGSAYEAITGNTNVPDMRDQFLRGKSATRSLGSAQDDAFQGHRHTLSYDSYYGTTGSGGSDLSNTNGPFDATREDRVLGPITDGTNGTPRTASETRPKNIAVNYFIKVN